jgi:hypothetical protein
MSAAPAFPDCAFPDDCQCAARGYQHEMDSCAVPRVAASAADFGIDPTKLFGRIPPPRNIHAELVAAGFDVIEAAREWANNPWDEALGTKPEDRDPKLAELRRKIAVMVRLEQEAAEP